MAVDAPWFIRNADIQRDLEWTVLQKFIVKKAEKLHRNLATHPNQELRNLTAYDPEEAHQNLLPQAKGPIQDVEAVPASGATTSSGSPCLGHKRTTDRKETLSLSPGARSNTKS